MKSFGSDNHSGIHPKILEAIALSNRDHCIAYGGDPYTAQAEARFAELFGPETGVFFAFNGTGANVLGLMSATRPFNSILSVDTAHINVDECGAPEKATGCKVITMPNRAGKLTVEAAKSMLHGFDFEHHSQPGVISISQATELGTLYTTSEIRDLTDLAHQYGLYLHIDGARFANAIAASGVTPKEMVQGADLLSFGGTKNGMMIGEAVVVLNPELGQYLKYQRKQSMQLCSKMRFIAAQFLAYLKDDLWLEMARHSNAMAQLLYRQVQEIPGVTLTQVPEANSVFAILPDGITEQLMEEYFFYVWDESTGEVRWMCSFDTTEQDIENFVAAIKRLIAQ